MKILLENKKTKREKNSKGITLIALAISRKCVRPN